MRDVDFDNRIAVLQHRIAALEHYVQEGQVRGGETLPQDFQALQIALEELHVAYKELRQQHEELAITHQSAEIERQRYQDLFDLAPDGYLVTDGNAIVQEANRTAAALLAVSPKALQGKPLVVFVAQDQHQLFYNQLKLIQQQQIQSWEMDMRPRRGAPFSAAITLATTYDAEGKEHRLCWLFRNITEQKRAKIVLQEAHDELERRVAERTAYLHQMNDQQIAEIAERRQVEHALRESEQRFRAVFDQAAVGIALHGVDGRWLQVNQWFCNLVGYPAEELLEQSWPQTTHPDDIAPGVAYIRRLLAGEIPAYSREKRYITKQGTEVWGKLTVSLVRDPLGVPKYFIDVVEDISARKTAEEQTRQAEQALRSSRQRLRRLATYLQDAQENERQRIARELHDDLAQTLTGLKYDVSWLGKQMTTMPPPWKKRIQAMSAQIEDLIKSTHRIGTELRPTILDDLGLLSAIEWQLQQIRRRTGLRYTLSMPDEEEICLDQARATAMFRIFQEALTNVVRHAEASHVAVRVVQHPDALLLVVTDNGKGITPEQCRNRSSLGLLGMHERAAFWDGDITMQGTPGKGTTLTLRIPSRLAEGKRHDSDSDC